MAILCIGQSCRRCECCNLLRSASPGWREVFVVGLLFLCMWSNFQYIEQKCSMNFGRLLTGKDCVGWVKGMVRCVGCWGNVSYIPVFKLASKILIGKIVCLSLSWFSDAASLWVLGYTGWFRRNLHYFGIVFACKVKIKVKFTLEQAKKAQRGVEVSYTLSLTSALDGVCGQRHVPAALPPGKTSYPLYRRLGGPRAYLDGCRKSRSHRDSIPRPSSPWRVAILTELYRPTVFKCGPFL
jgi:hypothetical protein